MPRGRGGLIGMIGSGVGMAAEYREHRKQQKISRENSQQDETAIAGPSTRPQPQHASISSSPDLPPSYAELPDTTSERSLASEKAAPGDKKAALAQYGDDESSSDDGLIPFQDDEAAWELDEALERSEPSTPDETQKAVVPVSELVREVVNSNKAALAAAPGFERCPLPLPVILPQRRPRKKTRGFVRAYAPLLGECSGIDQETFIKFINNFDKASHASPVWGVIQLSAAIAGLAPSVIAMAVTTAVQIGAQVGEEVQTRQRANSFLDKMNEELFKPAGLYAMIVKYKSEQQAREEGNSMLARFGVSGAKIDFNTNQAVAKYDRTLSDKLTGSGSRSMSDRLQGIRLASGQSQGAMSLPECAELIYPEIDKAMVREGPETFKDKAKDAKTFLGSYMDRRAARQYAEDDPNSALVVPESQRQFKSKLADPKHPMYNGGLIGFVSGGALTRDRGGMSGRQEKRIDKDERRMFRYEQRMSGGRDLSRKQQRRYDRIEADEEFYSRERQQYGYGGQRGMGGLGPGGRRRGGLIGLAGGLISAASSGGQSKEYEDSYNNRLGTAPHGADDRYGRRSFDERSNAPAPHAPYGGQQGYFGSNAPAPHAPYGGQQSYTNQYSYQQPYGGQYQHGQQEPYQSFQQQQHGQPGYAGYGRDGRNLTRDPRRSQAKRGGLVGGVKKMMKEEVLYLMIVNMPSEAELAEARETLARAKSGQ